MRINLLSEHFKDGGSGPGCFEEDKEAEILRVAICEFERCINVFQLKL